MRGNCSAELNIGAGEEQERDGPGAGRKGASVLKSTQAHTDLGQTNFTCIWDKITGFLDEKHNTDNSLVQMSAKQLQISCSFLLDMREKHSQHANEI